MALDYAAEILALKKAIASGVTSVTYDGKRVDYDSLEKMLARLRWLEAGQTGISGATAGFATFDRDE